MTGLYFAVSSPNLPIVVSHEPSKLAEAKSRLAKDQTRIPKLFRLRARNTGRWASRNLKVSIADIRAGDDVNPYGTFSVLIRDIGDTDNRTKICNSDVDELSLLFKMLIILYQF